METPFTAKQDLDSDRIISTLHKLAVERLTKKQKKILLELSQLEKTTTATNFAEEISRKLGCGRSTLFLALSALEECSLIEVNKGKSVELTGEAKMIIRRGLNGSN